MLKKQSVNVIAIMQIWILVIKSRNKKVSWKSFLVTIFLNKENSECKIHDKDMNIKTVSNNVKNTDIKHEYWKYKKVVFQIRSFATNWAKRYFRKYLKNNCNWKYVTM